MFYQCQILLVDGIIYFFYIPDDFVSSSCINCWERGTEVSNYVDFSFQFLLNVFWSSFVWYINLYDCCVEQNILLICNIRLCPRSGLIFRSRDNRVSFLFDRVYLEWGLEICILTHFLDYFYNQVLFRILACKLYKLTLVILGRKEFIWRISSNTYWIVGVLRSRTLYAAREAKKTKQLFSPILAGGTVYVLNSTHQGPTWPRTLNLVQRMWARAS